MEKTFQIQLVGQQVQQHDFDILGNVSGLADDRVFAELLRMTPYDGSTVSRGILPYQLHTGLVSLSGTVVPSGADGSVVVSPFRAFIGSRTAEATEARDNWHGIRSGLLVHEGDTSLTTPLLLAANSSGLARWDLVYAAVAVDADDETVTRKQKDTSTLVISDQTVVITKLTSISVAVQTGTPAASPAWPVIASDSGGTYYIPLAYVRVPNGFNGTATVDSKDIAVVAPTLRLAAATGAFTLSPADQQFTVGGGAGITTTTIASWGNNQASRPAHWLPSSMSGGETVVAYLDLTTGSETHANNAVVDSRDWRGRLVRWTACVDPTVSIVDSFYSAEQTGDDTNNQIASGMGYTGHNASASRKFLDLPSTHLGAMNDGSVIQIYADNSDSGKMKVTYTGSPNCKVLLWMDFSGQIENAPR